MPMYALQIPFATPAFDEWLALRDEVLRKPLGLKFHLKDIAEEWDAIHLGCYSDQGLLLGGLILHPLSDEVVKMRQVAVRPDARGQGTGTHLAKAAEKLAFELGFRQMILHAREEAVPFYKKLHYKIVGKPFTEVGIRHRKMKKELRSSKK